MTDVGRFFLVLLQKNHHMKVVFIYIFVMQVLCNLWSLENIRQAPKSVRRSATENRTVLYP